MSGWVKYVLAGVVAAVIVHIAMIHVAPRALMDVALARVGGGHYNSWRITERVTPASRTIVRPSPDFAYSICPYDLAAGPIRLKVAPWDNYWSLSLYAANSDNYFVIDDREARAGAEITLVRAGRSSPNDAGAMAHSPSRRGIALIRRLAPTPERYAAAVRVAQADVCAASAP